MIYIIDFILFLAKTATILVVFIAAILFLASLRSNNSQTGGKIEFKDIGDRFEQIKDGFREFKNSDEDDSDANSAKKNDIAAQSAETVISRNDSENRSTDDDQQDSNTVTVNTDAKTAQASSTKAEGKKFWQFWKKTPEKKEPEKEKTLYVISFDGDVHAEEVKNLREEVSALIQIAEPSDEVLVNITSPGGAVNSYGLAASQLVRIRDKGLHLTVAVDEVAASGGYLMACVANRIIAAPFAIVGSIGVVAELPNFHKVLEKYNIDYEQFTAGEYKRTVTMFGENTDDAKKKFTEELNEVHLIFKDFVKQYRPDIDIEKIATGEYWLAVKAIEFGLVDELQTSDAYIQEAIADKNVYSIKYVEKTTVRQGLSRFLTRIMKRLPF